MIYHIHSNGKLNSHDTNKDMVNRADMAFYGISSRDIIPPKGYTLTFDTPDKEPTFIPLPHEWYRTRFTGNLVCRKCKLLPLDSDDYHSICIPSEEE